MNDKSFEIDGTVLEVDKQATQEFYLTENERIDVCTCDDCLFYVNTLIKQPYEIFQLLAGMGVDLEKNLSSDPEGAWCVLDGSGEFCHCTQVCLVMGTIMGDRDEVKYSRFENGFRVNARFNQIKPDHLQIVFQIDRVSDENVIIKF